VYPTGNPVSVTVTDPAVATNAGAADGHPNWTHPLEVLEVVTTTVVQALLTGPVGVKPGTVCATNTAPAAIIAAAMTIANKLTGILAHNFRFWFGFVFMCFDLGLEASDVPETRTQCDDRRHAEHDPRSGRDENRESGES
jgi:hypothetical protein